MRRWMKVLNEGRAATRPIGYRPLSAGVAALAATLAAFAPAAQAQAREDAGTLPDGTEYLIRVPANWNGTLIRDLDYASGASAPLRVHLLEQGYALAGTGRHRLRALRWDPAVEIANLDLVLDMFEERFRAPDRLIQYGCSGGGAVGLNIAEDYHERVNGVVAMAAHITVWQMNTYLDGWFVLKALIAPNLPIVDLPFDGDGGVTPDVTDAWASAIDRAQQTPEGRARLALAFTIGQWPAWTSGLTPQPALDDVEALQHSIYHAALQQSSRPGGNGRVRKELAADGQQLSWNTGVDYREFFANGNESLQAAVRQLYRQAGLDLDAELARINAFPRVEASPYALEWWNKPGRTAKGDVKIPVMRVHEIGDPSIPTSLIQGYGDLIRAHGRGDLYRIAVVEGPSHCGYTVGEGLAAIETMVRRLDTGRWGSTEPAALNELAASLHASGGRFLPLDKYAQRKYNRTWAPE